MCEFRKLKASELQCKTTDTKFKGSATILIYKDARVDQRVLDETVGPMRWQKDYKEIDGKVYCGVAIKNSDTGEWVWKFDCGTEGNFEAEKSEASDAFKRACFNWGLGRELYDTPKIKIKCPDSYYYSDKLNMTFTVKSIEWDGDTLMDLVIVDRNDHIVYDYKNGGTNLFNAQNNIAMRVTAPPQVQQMTEEEKFFKMDNKELLIQFCRETKPTLKTEQMVGELERFYKFYNPKMDGWKGNLNLENLWKNWCSRIKK